MAQSPELNLKLNNFKRNIITNEDYIVKLFRMLIFSRFHSDEKKIKKIVKSELKG